MFKSRIAVLCALVILAELVAYTVLPQNYGIVPALALGIAIFVFGYYELNSVEDRGRRSKQLIKEKGDYLLHIRNQFSLVELSNECGWSLDDAKDSERFRKWVDEVAKEENWVLSDGVFMSAVITKKAD